MGQPRGPSGAFIRYARYLADLQAMPQGGVCSLETKRHPRPARLLSARFGKAGARDLESYILGKWKRKTNNYAIRRYPIRFRTY